MLRLAGSSRRATGTWWTAAISEVSTGTSRVGWAHHPTTEVTSNPLRGMWAVSYTHLDVYKRQLYESSARNPEPLLQPYSVLCWRARVDHSELSGLLRLPAEGLQITL